MKNFMTSIKLTKPKGSMFDLSHDVKMSLDMGQLVPCLVHECLPGDEYKIGCESLLRFLPMIAPVMHRMNITTHYFFVPNRVVWEGWDKWINDPQSMRSAPYVTIANNMSDDTKKFCDYMGIPPHIAPTSNYNVSALPFAAYQMIYDEYFRDQNLINPVNYNLVDGDNSANLELFKLRIRAWEHDLFTSALPFAQAGPPVNIPVLAGDVTLKDPPYSNQLIRNSAGTLPAGSENLYQSGGVLTREISPGSGVPGILDPNGTMEVTGGNTSLNELRTAWSVQRLLEKFARGGRRLKEVIYAHFGVQSPDARLQRPEYITAIKTPVTVSEVLNTTGEDGGLPQGNMAGHGLAVQNGGGKRYKCKEHGYIIGIVSVMPMTAYQQGVPKHYLKFEDQFNYFWPDLAHIGEEEVKLRELYTETPNGDQTFGYMPRYYDYRVVNSRVAGDLRTSLAYWHLGRIFSTAPALNQTFIECVPRKDIFAVESVENSLVLHLYHNLRAFRLVPKFGTPH